MNDHLHRCFDGMSMTLKGYSGKILEIKLDSGLIEIKNLQEDLAKRFIGGRGFIAKLLWDKLPRKTDPLSPDNILIVSTGVCTGHLGLSPNRVFFGAKSPLTGGYADSAMGGYFSPELKKAGYDYLLFTGKSSKPVYLLIEDENVKLKDASSYWGQGAITVEKSLKKELSNKHQIVTIGPAGEKLVRYSCITHNIGRNAGRTGIGAVMGSKNLKAIAVRGTKNIEVADKNLLQKLTKKATQEMLSNPFYQDFKKFGTNNTLPFSNEMGILPNKNFRCGIYRYFEKIGGEAQRKFLTRDLTCWACPLSCFMEVKLEKYGGLITHFSEYETTAMIGSNLEMKNAEDLMYANYLCNDYGLDTISTGSVLAFAIECFEKDIITLKDTGDLQLKFGDPELIFKLIKKIAYREGFGNLLAEGTKILSEMWGEKCQKFAMHMKGMEVSAYDSRSTPAMLLSYMTCDVGGHHNRSFAVIQDIEQGRQELDGKAELVIDLQHKRPLFDLLGVCRFPWVEMNVDLEYYPQLYNAVTGERKTLHDLLKDSERVWNLTRCLWIREKDISKSDDMPPQRWLTPFQYKGDPSEGFHLKEREIEQLLDQYYRLRGWDSEGKPTKEKLIQLGLEDIVRDLEK